MMKNCVWAHPVNRRARARLAMEKENVNKAGESAAEPKVEKEEPQRKSSAELGK